MQPCIITGINVNESIPVYSCKINVHIDNLFTITNILQRTFMYYVLTHIHLCT